MKPSTARPGGSSPLADPSFTSVRAPRRSMLRSAGARHGALLGLAMGVAGGLDYLVNVVAGRELQPVDFGVFVAITALVQVLTLLTVAIRMVVAFYTAQRADTDAAVTAFVGRSWRWSWRWGLATTALLVALGPVVARALRLQDAWPVWAASGMGVMLVVREQLYGALQGLQHFGRLGAAQAALATLRLVLAASFIAMGAGATGAIAAQPIASLACVALMAVWLRRHLRRAPDAPAGRPVNQRYVLSTVVGLAAFGLLSNADALFVRHQFGPDVAADYAPVVTLAKLSLFLPWAIGLVLFPKVAQRRAAGVDARPILLLSLLAAVAPGVLASALFFVAPGFVVRTVFAGAYADPGAVLGIASLAATTYAGLHIWLNYALSLERNAYVYALVGVTACQGAGMFLFGRESVFGMTVVMLAAGIAGNVAGWMTTRTSPAAARVAAAVAMGP